MTFALLVSLENPDAPVRALRKAAATQRSAPLTSVDVKS